MAKYIILLLLALNCLAEEFESGLGYIEDLNVQHKKDKWICGENECKTGSTGCHIKISNSAITDKVDEEFKCIGGSSLARDAILNKHTKVRINIDLKISEGVKSKYTIDCSHEGLQKAKGEVALKDLEKLKKECMAQKQKPKKKSNNNNKH